MLSVRRRVGVLGLLVMAGTCMAEPPAALDRVPAGAGVVVAIRNFERFEAESRKVAEALRMDPTAIAGLDQLKKALDWPGVRKDGSFAVFSLPGADQGDPEAMVALVPMADPAAAVKAAGGKEGDIITLPMPEREVYMRDAGGGWGLFGLSHESVKNAPTASGQSGAHVARMGRTGGIAESADLLVIADGATAKPALAGVRDRVESSNNAVRMLTGDRDRSKPGEPPAAPDAAPAYDYLDDVSTTVAGITLGEAGMTFDFGGVFREGSRAARALTGGGRSGDLIARLPAQQAYVTLGADLSVPAVRSIMDGMADADNAPPILNAIITSMKSSDGVAMSMGQTPGGVMGGTLLASTITYLSTPKPAEMLAAIRAGQASINGKAMGPATAAVEHKPDQPLRDMNEQLVDTWTTTLTFDETAAGSADMEMILSTVLGGNMFSTMAAATDKGVYMALSKNSRLMRSAITASRGERPANDPLAGTRAMLQDGRSFEMYLGVKPILEAVRDGFMLDDAAMPLPEAVSPVAMGAAVHDGALHVRVAVPRDAMGPIGAGLKLVNPGAQAAPRADALPPS